LARSLLNLNGLNMYEMLRALDGLSRERRAALMNQRQTYRDVVNIPRIEYAAAVVETRRLSSAVPGDLAATGQVQTATKFLQERRSEPGLGRMTHKQFVGAERDARHGRACIGDGRPGNRRDWLRQTHHRFGEEPVRHQGARSVRLGARADQGIRQSPVCHGRGGLCQKYESFEQSVTEHARFFLRNRRYANGWRCGTMPTLLRERPQRPATRLTPNYADVLIKVMRDHNLYRFDRSIEIRARRLSPRNDRRSCEGYSWSRNEASG
jgi:hypothetical protein